MYFSKLLPVFLSFFAAAATVSAQENPLVRFKTNQGDIDVRLRYDVAPLTVINFLNYANRGAFNNTIFHRSVPGFVVQGGGYQLIDGKIIETPSSPPVRNEYNLSNLRGTIAMAKFGGDPNSATSQWFFNLGDNSANLNRQNGGFTVFGTIVNNEGLAVIDKIAAQKVIVSGQFDSLPVINHTTGDAVAANYIVVTAVEQLETLTPPAIRATDGVIAASSFGGFKGAAPGTYIEVYGSNLAGTTREWGRPDFSGNGAPTTLDNVSVSINGRAAFVYFVSPTQVNAQVPDSFPTAGNYPVVLNYRGLTSSAYTFAMSPVRPGLLAPASFKVGTRQFAAPVHSANGALVANSSIAGVAPAPARPGETIIFYGMGFGSVQNTQRIAGSINTSIAPLEGSVEFNIGGLRAEVAYAGLTPGLVGLVQLNVVVPEATPTGDHKLDIFFNSAPIEQELYLPVQR